MKTIIDAAVQRRSHFFAPGPKRILALDGGGIRGIISLAFVERIEAMLARRRGGWGFRVADYFDLIGGTSTGAIIATGLALGKSAGEMIELYLTLAKKGFRRNRWIGGTFAPKFDAKALRAVIIEQFGQETLGSDKLRCGLGIVAKRIDTGSVWLFHNHPRGMFYGAEGAPDFTPNRDLLLSDLLRASSAAPSYFAPEPIEVAPGVKGLFVDGGVSPHNNPALLLMMLATIQGYGFRWPTGADRLMVASVGTGAPGPRPIWKDYSTMPPVLLAVESLRSMMQDSNSLAQTMLQWMSASPMPWRIDGEVGDLGADQLAGQPLLHYLRYDAPVTEEWLGANLGIRLTEKELGALAAIDRPEMAARLLEIGRRAAEVQVREEHFPGAFDGETSNCARPTS